MKLNLYTKNKEEDEWYGDIFLCLKCGHLNIWRWFKFCPTCAEPIEWIREENLEPIIIPNIKEVE